MTTEQLKIFPEDIRLSVRYNYILFPFYTMDLLSSLARTQSGYTLAQPPKSPKPPVGAKLDWAGPIARKDNVIIDFDGLPQIMGAEGKSPNDVVRIFSEVENTLYALGLKEENIRFYEAVANYSVETSKNSYEVMSKIKPQGDLFEKLERIFNEQIFSYAIHFRNKGDTVERHDWFDMRIQPSGGKSSVFDIVTVFRNKEKSKVTSFLSNIEKSMEQIFQNL